MNVFKEQRQTNKMTQKEVADFLDIKNTTVSNWEIGLTFPSKNNLIKLSKLFECGIEKFFKNEKGC